MSKHIANIQVTRPHCSNGKDKVVIRINCENSNIRIVEVEMDPADFLAAIMGRGDMKGEVVYWDHTRAANVGKNLLTRVVTIEKYQGGYDKKAEAKYIRNHPGIVGAMKDGWEIHDDGMCTRQPADHHMVIMRRYEDV